MTKLHKLNFSLFMFFFFSIITGCSQVSANLNMKEPGRENELRLDTSTTEVGVEFYHTNLQTEESVPKTTCFKRIKNFFVSENIDAIKNESQLEPGISKLSFKKLLLGGLIFVTGAALGGGTTYGILEHGTTSNDEHYSLNYNAKNNETVAAVGATTDACTTNLNACLINVDKLSTLSALYFGYATGNKTLSTTCNTNFNNLTINYNILLSQNTSCAVNLNTTKISRDNCLSDLANLRTTAGTDCITTATTCQNSLNTCNLDKQTLTTTCTSEKASLQNSCNQDKSVLQANIDTTQGLLGVCQSNYTVLNQNYNLCNTNLNSNISALTTTQESLSLCQNTRDDYYLQLGNKTSLYSDCANNLTTCTSDRNTCNTAKSECNTSLNSTQVSLSSCEDAYSSSNTTITNLQGNVTALNDVVAICNTAKDALTEQLAISTSQVVSNQTYNLCVNNLAVCSSLKDAYNQNWTSCQTDFNSYNDTIIELNGTISDMNSTIHDLNSSLENCITRKANLTEELAIAAQLTANQTYQILQLRDGIPISDTILQLQIDLDSCQTTLYGNSTDGTVGCSGLLNGYVDESNVTYPGCIADKTEALLELITLNDTYDLARRDNWNLNTQLENLNTTISTKNVQIQDLNTRVTEMISSFNDAYESDHFINLNAKLTLPNSTDVSLSRINFNNYYNTTYPLSLSIEAYSTSDLISLDQVAASLNPKGTLTVSLLPTNSTICKMVPTLDLSGFIKVNNIKIGGRSYITILGPANMDNATLSTSTITNSIYDLKNGFFDLSTFVPCAGNASSIKSNNVPPVYIYDSRSMNGPLLDKMDGNYAMQFSDFQVCYPELLANTGFLSSGKLANNVTTYNAGEYLNLDNTGLFTSNSRIFDIISNMTSLKYVKMTGVSVTSDQVQNALNQLGDVGDVFCIHHSTIMGGQMNVTQNTILACAQFYCSTYSNNSTCAPDWTSNNFMHEVLLIDRAVFYVTPTSVSDTAAVRLPYGIGVVIVGSASNYPDGSVVRWQNGTGFGGSYVYGSRGYVFGGSYNLNMQYCLA